MFTTVDRKESKSYQTVALDIFQCLISAPIEIGGRDGMNRRNWLKGQTVMCT